MPGSILGTQVRRVEDEELLLGQGTFVDNLDSDGVAHAAFVRSPFAHARITAIDTSAAVAAEGVLAVFTADDLGRDGLQSFANVNKLAPRAALAVDKVRYAGDPVALVIAETETEIGSMTVSAAVHELDMTESQTIVFRNAAHGGLSVVYRRPDGNIGWIDPERTKANGAETNGNGKA